LRTKLIAVAVAIALAAIVVAAASAGKPASGSSTGTAMVFADNPVQSSGDESLTDQKDSDAAVPASAYYKVALTNLNGSGFLCGDWACVASETGDPAYSPTNTFSFTRSQDEFEQTMAYYWITEAQKYVQSLGFGSKYRGANNKAQQVRINQLGYDNSFETTQPSPQIRYGKGGVDDAEDAEVILHEYGHAIHEAQGFQFASEQAGAISEGFGDYFAASATDVILRSLGVKSKTPLVCLMDWDSTSYTSTVPHCIRRLDAGLHYPDDLSGEVHHDGTIWSQALWTIHQSLGNVKADTIILQGQFDFPGTTMTDLANRTVAAASSLYGAKVAGTVRAAFAARGIL
jgi:zinc metalloprotease ZmpB